MPALRLHEVILYVQDMDRQVTFYRDVLGLRMTAPVQFPTAEELHWVTFETGACTLALHSGGDRNFGADAPRFVFSVENLSEFCEHLQRAGLVVSDIRSPAPGIQVADTADPEGNCFSLESIDLLSAGTDSH